jgi:amidophosphoribosyltransferase
VRLRKLAVAKKFGLLTGNFQNKRVVLVDDSIVRGNTMKPIILMLKNAGAKEVGFYTFCTIIWHEVYVTVST